MWSKEDTVYFNIFAVHFLLYEPQFFIWGILLYFWIFLLLFKSFYMFIVNKDLYFEKHSRFFFCFSGLLKSVSIFLQHLILVVGVRH